MSIITVGIDLAKSIFSLYGVNEAGKPELVKPKVAREQLLPLVANLLSCLIGMEACTALITGHDCSDSTVTPFG